MQTQQGFVVGVSVAIDKPLEYGRMAVSMVNMVGARVRLSA